MLDVRLYSGGSVIGFAPITVPAKEWIDDNLSTEGWQWLGNVLYVDHRFAETIATAMIADGLEIGE